MPRVGIVVVSHNARRALSACLESVLRNTGGAFEVLVIDNASTDGSSAILRSFARRDPRVSFRLSSGNLGKAAAINRAARLLKTPWYVILDDDAEVPPGWLRRLMGSAAAARPAPAVVGCRSVYGDGRIHGAELPVSLENIWDGERDLGQRDYTRFCDIVLGTCMLVRGGVLEELGFDESFGQQYEDVDFCLRAREAGHKVLYCGGVAVRHGHLFRGPRGRFEKNRRRSAARWGAPAFPDSHPLDKTYSALCRTRDAGDWKTALRLCRRLQRMDPVPAYAHWWEAATLSYLGDTRGAARKLRQALAGRCLSDVTRKVMTSFQMSLGKGSPS